MHKRLVLKSHINLICNTLNSEFMLILTLYDSCDVDSHEVVLLFCIALVHVKQIAPRGQ